ncbi:1077_t:CDS:2 [Acaulospora colombiana]|uniref:1077_t:CDS:1 n=1 Tax=Acaulospora colombiana TaxID=27376 RepID=A0ACA9N257_9GLOM|nr:1077_t:CDS:2 [Acaulospora colombiana]
MTVVDAPESAAGPMVTYNGVMYFKGTLDIPAEARATANFEGEGELTFTCEGTWGKDGHAKAVGEWKVVPGSATGAFAGLKDGVLVGGGWTWCLGPADRFATPSTTSSYRLNNSLALLVMFRRGNEWDWVPGLVSSPSYYLWLPFRPKYHPKALILTPLLLEIEASFDCDTWDEKDVPKLEGQTLRITRTRTERTFKGGMKGKGVAEYTFIYHPTKEEANSGACRP